MGIQIDNTVFDGMLAIAIRDSNVQLTETNKIIYNGRTILNEIPEREYGVSITKNGSPMTEIRDSLVELGANEFYVDYKTGFITFQLAGNPDGTKITAEYTGRGVILYPAERILYNGKPIIDGLSSIYSDGVLVASGVGKLDFRQNLTVTVDPTDPTRVIINADAGGGGFGGKFIDLTDAPSTYTGQAGKVVSVTSGESGIEFSDVKISDILSNIESGKVIILNYQGNGRFSSNNTSLNIPTNKYLKVKFNGTIPNDDLSLPVQIRFKDTDAYQDLEYLETGFSLTVKNIITKIQDLYFDGTKFIATYVDSSLENQKLPYTGNVGAFNTPENGIGVIIGEKTVSQPDDMRGLAYEQLVSNGDFSDGTTDWTPIRATGSVTNEIYSLVGDGSNVSPYLRKEGAFPEGNNYFDIKARVTNSDCTVMLIQIIDGVSNPTISIDTPTINQWYNIRGILNVDTYTQIRIQHTYPDTATANGAVMEIDYAYAIPVPDLLSTKTADELASIFPRYIAQGLHRFGESGTYTPSNFSDKMQETIEAQGYTDGDTINGVWVNTFGNNLFDKKSNDYIVTASNVQVLDTGLKITSSSDGTYRRVDYNLYLKCDTSYYFNTDINTISGNGSIAILNGNDGSQIRAGNGTFTSPNDGYIKIRFYVTLGTVSSGDVEFTNIMLNIGTTALPYEEYEENSYWTDFVGASLPNGTQDDFEYQRIQRYILQESDIASLISATNVDYVQFPRTILSGNNLGADTAVDTSDKLIVEDFNAYTGTSYDNTANENTFSVRISSSNVTFIVPKGTYASLAEAQADLAGTVVYYELETYLPRTLDNNNLLTSQGALTITPYGQYTLTDVNGVGYKFYATSAINTKAQTKENTDSIVTLTKDVKALNDDVKLLQDTDKDFVTLTDDQTITGVKSFVGSTRVLRDGVEAQYIELVGDDGIGGPAIRTSSSITKPLSISNPTNDSILFKNGASLSEKMRITPNGNVGIGADSPVSKLSVQDVSPILTIGNTTANQTLGGTIDLVEDATYGFDSTNSYGFRLTIDGIENKFFIKSRTATEVDTRFTIDRTSGNVGIGKTNPTEKLDVNGNIKASGSGIFGGNTIKLNANETGTPSQSAGIEIERGTEVNKSLLWNESVDKWQIDGENIATESFVSNGETIYSTAISVESTTLSGSATTRNLISGKSFDDYSVFELKIRSGFANATIRASFDANDNYAFLSIVESTSLLGGDIVYRGRLSRVSSTTFKFYHGTKVVDGTYDSTSTLVTLVSIKGIA